MNHAQRWRTRLIAALLCSVMGLPARADEESEAPPAAVHSRSEWTTMFEQASAERNVVDLLRKSTAAEQARLLELVKGEMSPEPGEGSAESGETSPESGERSAESGERSATCADDVGEAPPAAVHSRSEWTTMFNQSVTENLQRSKDGNALELQSGVLIEDDGPAAGYSYQPNEELLSEQVRIKKELIVDRPRARKATLLIGRAGKMQPPLEVTINGETAKLEPAGRAGRHWEAYTFDPTLLVAGKNEFVLRGSGKIWIARDEDFAAGSRERRHHPNRSAKSLDGGQTWNYEHLGTHNDLDGEYYVRLFLDQPAAKGKLVSPVIDVGNLGGKLIGPPITAVGPLRISLQTGSEQQAGVRLSYRTSSNPAPQATGWSAWRELPSNGGTIESPTGRYLQFALELVAHAGGSSPQVRDVSIEATPKLAADWTSELQNIQSHNEQIVRTTIPFEYEPLDQPQLKQLRQQYKLDDVVKDASNEFEQICRLAAWSSQQWDKMHLAQSYPAWNALEILSPHADGKPIGGFCQQYNLVFLQACESFGLSGRAVSIDQGTYPRPIHVSGHEVVEIWSNDYKKWVYVDGNCAWYAVDQASGTPLSLLELRERQIATLNGDRVEPIRIIKLAETRHKWEGLTSWPAFVELRLIPRSNFLEQKAPLPLNQGMSGWFWTGHRVWEDELAPATLLYGHRERKESNFSWTLNQAHYTLEALSEPGHVRVHLETVTPGFETFLAKIDDAAVRPVEPSFVWKLHAGKNRLEVRPRNTAGRDGMASWIDLQWRPE